MTLTMAERETHIKIAGDEDEWAFETDLSRDIRALREDDRFTEVKSIMNGDVEWVRFTIPKDRWSVIGGAKRRMSADQKERMAQRLKDNLTKVA